MAARPYHVVVWGGTGVVGRLVSEHLARDYQKQGVKWAMAGRNRQKLESIREELAKIDSSVKDIPIITADIGDKASLEKLASKTKVVLATVGPFALSGTPMVEACVSAGTNYCDITGENPWVRKMIRQYDDEAKRKGIRIVHMCGFDSIPSDLGTYLVVDHMSKQYNKSCARVEILFSEIKGALSGGTVASLFNALFDEQGPDKVAVKDPYGLDPPTSSRGPDKPDSFLPGYSSLHDAPYMPFVMAPVNTRVVRRSNALRDHAYGKNFSYLEAQKMPNRFAAWLGSLIFLFFGAMISIRPLRSLWTRLLPPPGKMPKRELLTGGCWAATVIGVSDEPSGSKPVVVRAKISGEGDPGYWSTSRLLLESGLCIALQEAELRESDALQAGVLTPATALGAVLLKRLNMKMCSFKIVEG